LILVLRRADPPILIFNRDGKLVNSFGDRLFKRPHSLDVDRDGFVWATDTDENVVYKFTMQGKLLMTLGKKDVAGDNDSHDLFNGPTDVAVAPNGDIFVSDGDRNNRIVKFTKDGKFVKIIGGTKSSAPGQFGPAPGTKASGGLVHAIAFDSKGRLITIESFNPRIQAFDQDGNFIQQWVIPGLMKPCGLAIAPDDTIYIGDTDAGSITLVKDGKVIDQIHQAGIRPHNVGLDSTGALFIADVDVEKAPSNATAGPTWNQTTAGIWRMVKN
jgi:DNA-binding beta-propeller fold protein YncE